MLHKMVSFVSLTGAVCVVHKVHLERMAVIEDSACVGLVILEFQTPERGVILGFHGHNVDGRLSRPISDGKILGPFIRSWNRFMF